MYLQVCISTLDEGLGDIIGRLPLADDVGYLIGHQRRGSYADPILDARWRTYVHERADIEYVSLNSLGLSRNRNALIQASKGEILLFSDDDVEYLPGFSSIIKQAYAKRPRVDAITFRTSSDERVKKYSGTAKPHNLISAAGVSSIEITVRRDVIARLQIGFDDRFGLGTENPSGEEYIFITDLIRAGVSVERHEGVINRHSGLSSGRLYFDNEAQIRTKGRMFRRAAGSFVGTILMIMFAVKKYPEYKNSWSFIEFCRLLVTSKL